MKKLVRIRLVNWYHLQDETLPVDGSVLFMGDNGSGKSTILDALQFVLVADLTQVKFNQAANENAARSLQGYTRWMTNSEGSRDTHQYRRGSCSSYVLLEFLEKIGAEEVAFTVGVVVDSFADGSDPHRLHFAVSLPLSEIPIFKENTRVPLNTADFRKLMTPRKGFFASREPGAFRDDLLIRLGRLSPDFTKILVKAQAFKPLGQVQQFVMDFLLDPRPLETRSLRANLGHYKGLEQKAGEAEKRITQLELISGRGVELGRVREEIHSHRYLELRSLAGVQEARVESLGLDLGKARTESTCLEENLLLLGKTVDECKQELGSIHRALSQHSGWQERERIKVDLRRASLELTQARAELTRAEEKKAEFTQLLAELEKELQAQKTDLDSGAPQLKVENLVEAKAPLLREAVYATRTFLDRCAAALELTKAQGEALRRKLEELKKGVRNFPKEAQALKGLIEDQLGCEAPLLCELIEVGDEHWQGAVEGYLNSRRFDIVLDPKHFSKALRLYEKMKIQLHLHGVGLVDSEKVLKARREPKSRSLAELISSSNEWAKAYADFILGEVIRCESEQELRKHTRAITPTCMVYQNFAARQTEFRIFESWYIGSRGHAHQITSTEREITEAFEKFKREADRHQSWEKIAGLISRAELAAQLAEKWGELQDRLRGAQAEVTRLEAQFAALNTDEINVLENREKDLQLKQEKLGKDRDQAHLALGKAQQRVQQLGLALEESGRLRDFRFGEIAVAFGSEELKAQTPEFESRYREELERRPPEKIHEVYEAQRRGRETRRANLLTELVQLRTEYNNAWGLSAPAQGEDIAPYLAELDSWKNSFLPEYRQKIMKAKDLAMQELMEDIVHKLRENLDLIPSQFEQINRGLRGFHFGHDQYQFAFQVKAEFRAFEKLIREAALYERQPLFETNWRERFKDGGALEALFESLVQGSSNDVERELEQYSDYREYYEYDLKILHADGTESFYSRVNRWKSGGETQTPYYIAVLASLYRLYRLQPEQGAKQRGTIGLVILDEAFNKMDEDHLRATLEFTRKLGLQLIMATPKERAEFIIPHVESCYIVAKDPQSGLGFLQDFHQEFAVESGF